MIEVELVGGPYDGVNYTVERYVPEVGMPTLVEHEVGEPRLENPINDFSVAGDVKFVRYRRRLGDPTKYDYVVE